MSNPASHRFVGRWATLRIRAQPLSPGDRDPATVADVADRLGELGSLLALGPGVDGVETRDPTTVGDVERTELWVYTDPDNLPSVQRRAEQLGSAMQLRLRFDAEVRTDDDWHDAWKTFYRPLVFGDRTLLLRPSWIERRPDDPTREIVLDPGRAFGTGLHATTRLCLDRICALFEARRPQDGEATEVVIGPHSILDLGCGSGILGIACARLFEDADRIVMVDIDPEATATARENAERCGLAARVDIRTGDLQQVGESCFDLILANIRPEVLIPHAQALADRLHPRGRLILGGILDHEAQDVRDAYARVGLVLDRLRNGGIRRLEGWTALDLVSSNAAS